MNGDEPRWWPRAVALGAALVVLGGAVLEVEPELAQPVAFGALVVVAVLVVGWARLP